MRRPSRHRLFVISDLHLGGRPDRLDENGRPVAGSSLFSSPELLADFLSWLADEAAAHADETYELVINGDIFDLLCAAGDEVPPLAHPQAVGQADALRLTQRIFCQYGDGDRSPLQALAHYLRGPGRLTLMIGNHDVELSFPAVRNWLGDALGAGPGRIRWIYDGEAYGIGNVLIEHGNRYDPWNVVDHDTLRQERALLSRLALPPDGASPTLDQRCFQPPAGSWIVAYVINGMKGAHRFVDLLKPENETVIPLLLSLCRPSAEVLADILAVAPVLAQRLAGTGGVKSGKPVHSRYLAASDAEGEDAAALIRAALDAQDVEQFPELDLLAAALRDGDRKLAATSASDLAARLRASVERLRRSLSTAAAVGALLLPGNREKTLPRLAAALKALNRVDMFCIEREVQPYLGVAQQLVNGGGFDVVVFGHTHLPKLQRWGGPRGTATYINTGTWADVARLPPSLLAGEPSELDAFARKLAANDHAEYVRRYTMFAEILLQGDAAQFAQLWRFRGRDTPRGSPVLEP